MLRKTKWTVWALRELSWLTHGIFLQTWCSFSFSYSVQLKSEDRTIRGNSKSCKPHYRAGPRVILTWQEIVTFTDKETCMHAYSYSGTVISRKPKKQKSLFSRNKQSSKDIKHFTTASEIKSYQGHLPKHKNHRKWLLSMHVRNLLHDL